MVVMQVNYSCSNMSAEEKVIRIMVWNSNRWNPRIIPQKSLRSCHYKGLQEHLPHEKEPLDACPKFHAVDSKKPDDKMCDLHEIHAETCIYHKFSTDVSILDQVIINEPCHYKCLISNALIFIQIV